MKTPDATLLEEVTQSIGKVHDPCSIAMGRPLDLVSMGIVEGIDVTEGRVAVRLVLTDPMCFVQADILKAVDEAVRLVSGVKDCKVSIDGNILWTSERISSSSVRGESARAAARAAVGLPSDG
ncbi:metal-sulfur cluster assembly factor [Rhodococcus koreensis]